MAQEEAPLDTTSIYRAAIRLARHRTARERGRATLAALGPRPAGTGSSWGRDSSHQPTAWTEHQRSTQTGRWTGSAQVLHEIGHKPTPNCQQCRDTDCGPPVLPCAARRPTPPAHPADLCRTDESAPPDPRCWQHPTDNRRSSTRRRCSRPGRRLQSPPEPIGHVAGVTRDEGKNNNNNCVKSPNV